MAEMSNFDVDFVCRTKEILQDYAGKWDMTILVNCMLGLVVLPYEKNKSDNPNKPAIWGELICNIHELKFEEIYFNPIKKRKKNNDIVYYDKTLENLLRKIRNGITHQHIEPVNHSYLDTETGREKIKFDGIRIENWYPTKDVENPIRDLKIEFSQNQLNDFVHFIADAHLQIHSPQDCEN